MASATATAPRLGDRLRDIRHARFVGRGAEAALFRQVLAAEPLPLQVLYVFGPGGIGKTALAHEFLYFCQEAGVRSMYLDGREIDASPQGFSAALSAALGLGPAPLAAEELCCSTERQVLVVDTYENLAPLDDWLRESLLPRLPDSMLVVLSGRNPPSRV